jgi:hypothetical protein
MRCCPREQVRLNSSLGGGRAGPRAGRSKIPPGPDIVPRDTPVQRSSPSETATGNIAQDRRNANPVLATTNHSKLIIQLDIPKDVHGLIVFARSGLYQNILMCQKCNNDPACVFAVSPAPVGFVKDPFFVSSYR